MNDPNQQSRKKYCIFLLTATSRFTNGSGRESNVILSSKYSMKLLIVPLQYWLNTWRASKPLKLEFLKKISAKQLWLISYRRNSTSVSLNGGGSDWASFGATISDSSQMWICTTALPMSKVKSFSKYSIPETVILGINFTAPQTFMKGVSSIICIYEKNANLIVQNTLLWWIQNIS